MSVASALESYFRNSETRETVLELFKMAGTTDYEIVARKLATITFLSLQGRNCPSIEPVRLLTNLQRLSLKDAGCQSLGGIEACTNLVELHIDGNRPTPHSTPVSFPVLETLSLSQGCTDTLRSWSLPKLKLLIAWGCRLKSLTDLPDLPQLQVLQISENELTSLEGIDRLPKLKVLEADDNQIRDLSHLQSLPELRKLFLRDNQVSDISILSQCKRLKELYLGGNPITDFGPAQSMNLETLSFE